ncbi:MAG: hypothetical protein RBU30_08005 [Polyangia bacterium]|nr:hypothetical protein [Polyangia bacterium]
MGAREGDPDAPRAVLEEPCLEETLLGAKPEVQLGPALPVVAQAEELHPL